MNLAYEYDATLKAPTSMGGDGMTGLARAGQMEKVEKFIRIPVKLFRAKNATLTKGSYASSDGAQVEYYEFTPKETPKPEGGYPAIIYYHGGGFMLPIQKSMMQNSDIYAKHCGVKVFLPEYRRLPDSSCETIMSDCYEMMRYVFEHSSELEVDPNRVMLYGDSAGGCLAACVAIWNRERDGYPLRGQMLVYPVCDCESQKYDSMDEYRNGAWTKKANLSKWELFFEKGVDDKAKYVPMLNDCAGLPEAYVEPLQMDVLRDEALAYANKLKNAGVKVTCNLISGAYHAYDACLKSPLVQEAFNTRCSVINSWLKS